MSKPEEVLGMIQGLADALRSSHDNQKATQHQLEALAKTVHQLPSTEKPTKSIAHDDGQALRLPLVTLPVFKGDLKKDYSLPPGFWQFYFNRDLQRLYTGTCIILQKTINGFLCLLIVFLKSKTYQLILKDVIKLNRNLR